MRWSEFKTCLKFHLKKKTRSLYEIHFKVNIYVQLLYEHNDVVELQHHTRT